MIQALWSASSGMLAQQLSMDNVANNIANVNTAGFKKSRVEFQDLLYSQVREADKLTRTGQVVPNGIQIGSGSRPSSTQLIFEQGAIQETGNPLDMAISGNAFFEISLPDGTKAYTRDGSFKVDAGGYLVNAGGNLISMTTSDGGLITLPADASNITINDQGVIYQNKEILQLEGYTFASGKDLEEVEPGVFKTTDDSEEPRLLSEVLEEQEAEAEEQTDENGNPLPAIKKPMPQIYYEITLPDGETAYTTESLFKVDSDGLLVTAGKGYPLASDVSVDSLEVGGDALAVGSTVSADSQGIVSVPLEQARLNVVQFANPAGLEKIGSNLYRETANSGTPQAAADYKVLKGSLEMSNVQVADEMVNMMIAQRAYEINSRSIRNSDEMLGMANSLLRR